MNLTKYFYNLGVFIASILASLLATSCEKELDFEYHDIAPLTVIEASVTEAGAEVAITYTSPMDEPIDSEPLTDALVRLLDLTSGEEAILDVDSDGIFLSSNPGVPGHDYRLSVTVGDKHYSSTARMLNATAITEARFVWVRMPGDDMAVLQVNFADNPLTADYYWVRVYRNGEAYAWDILTDYARTDDGVEETITTTHRDPSKKEDDKQLLVDGDVIDISVTPISRGMFDYLNALLNGSNGTPQFEGDTCLGYFLPSPVAKTTIVYHPDEIDYAE